MFCPGKHLAHFMSHPLRINQGARGRPLEGARPAVAISAQTGSGALSIAERLAAHFKAAFPAANPPWTVFDKSLMTRVLEDHHLPARLARFLPEDANSVIGDAFDELFGLHPPASLIVQQTTETILKLAEAGNVILVGRGATVITSTLPSVSRSAWWPPWRHESPAFAKGSTSPTSRPGPSSAGRTAAGSATSNATSAETPPMLCSTTSPSTPTACPRTPPPS
jgi:hypothetical protein